MRTSFEAGFLAAWAKRGKITVEVPEELLASAQAYTGEGVTETVRTGLCRLASMRVQQQAMNLRGQVKLSLSLDEMRHDRD